MSIGLFNSWKDKNNFIFVELAVDDHAFIICLFGFGVIILF